MPGYRLWPEDAARSHQASCRPVLFLAEAAPCLQKGPLVPPQSEADDFECGKGSEWVKGHWHHVVDETRICQSRGERKTTLPGSQERQEVLLVLSGLEKQTNTQDSGRCGVTSFIEVNEGILPYAHVPSIGVS